MVIGVATGSYEFDNHGHWRIGFDFSFATGSYLWDQFLQFWRTFFVILPFALLGFLFAVVGRSAMPGIAIGIGILFLEPIITALMRLAGGWVDNIPDYLLNANVEAINTLNKLPQGFGGGFPGATTQYPSVIHAFTTLSIYILVFLVIAFYLFRRGLDRDLNIKLFHSPTTDVIRLNPH
jgi:MFS superfamily sulfate permease-like transporter